MIYLCLAAFIAGLGIGGYGGYAFEHSQVLEMKLAVSKLQIEASTKLSEANDRVNKATVNALEQNQQLETAHVQAIATINNLHERLTNVRLLDPTDHRQCSRNAVPKSDHSREPENEADAATLSAGLTEFLKRDLYDADATAEYAAKAWEFINLLNCGISQ